MASVRNDHCRTSGLKFAIPTATPAEAGRDGAIVVNTPHATAGYIDFRDGAAHRRPGPLGSATGDVGASIWTAHLFSRTVGT